MTTQSGPAGEPGRAGQPRLAVLIPVFNGQEGLERSLASLCDDGARFEVFVIDDGSAPPIALPDRLPSCTRLVRLARNQGITAALNVGLQQIVASGFEYIARLDAGDLSLPGRFDAQMNFLDAHLDHAVVGAHVEIVDEDGRYVHLFKPPTDHDGVLRRFRYENALCHPAVMIRTEALRTVGFYVDDYPAGEDYELWLRLARRHKLANLDLVLLRKERTPSSITARRHQAALSRLRIQLDHFVPWSIHAYLGIVRSLLLLLVSRDAVAWIRRQQGRWSAPSH